MGSTSKNSWCLLGRIQEKGGCKELIGEYCSSRRKRFSDPIEDVLRF
eukprot:IDg22643t1